MHFFSTIHQSIKRRMILRKSAEGVEPIFLTANDPKTTKGKTQQQTSLYYTQNQQLIIGVIELYNFLLFHSIYSQNFLCLQHSSKLSRKKIKVNVPHVLLAKLLQLLFQNFNMVYKATVSQFLFIMLDWYTLIRHFTHIDTVKYLKYMSTA